jgi:hypothetical protein
VEVENRGEETHKTMLTSPGILRLAPLTRAGTEAALVIRLLYAGSSR